MGKYIRKTKTEPEDAALDLSQPSLGVRTRAKTLALQLQQESSTTPAAGVPSPPTPDSGDGPYLQLRSRRLEKHPVALREQDSKRLKKLKIEESCGENPSPTLGFRVRLAKDDDVKREEIVKEINGNGDITNIINNYESKDFGGVEATFGENVLDVEAKERGTRESTPCNLIRDSESIRTPGSTTRPTSSAETNRRVQYSMREHTPTEQEMDDFFSVAEKEQQRRFIDKYNFDPLNDCPLPGPYKWKKLSP